MATNSHFRETANVQLNITTCEIAMQIAYQKVTAKRDANC